MRMPEEIVMDHVSGRMPELVPGVNCFSCPKFAIPREVHNNSDSRGFYVNFTSTGGLPDITFISGRESIQRPSVQVLITSAKDDYDGGQRLADKIHRDLQISTPEGAGNFSAINSMINIGKDEDDRYMFSLNYSFEICRDILPVYAGAGSYNVSIISSYESVDFNGGSASLSVVAGDEPVFLLVPDTYSEPGQDIYANGAVSAFTAGSVVDIGGVTYNYFTSDNSYNGTVTVSI